MYENLHPYKTLTDSGFSALLRRRATSNTFKIYCLSCLLTVYFFLLIISTQNGNANFDLLEFPWLRMGNFDNFCVHISWTQFYAFQNLTEIWEARQFHVTTCLEKTLLLWIPCVVFFILFVPYLLAQKRTARNYSTRKCTFCECRFVCIFCFLYLVFCTDILGVLVGVGARFAFTIHRSANWNHYWGMRASWPCWYYGIYLLFHSDNLLGEWSFFAPKLCSFPSFIFSFLWL